MLRLLTLLLLVCFGVAPAWAEPGVAAPAGQLASVSGSVSREGSLAHASLRVAASADKALPHDAAYLVSAAVAPDGGFELEVPLSPDGFYLWVVVEPERGGAEYRQLLGYYPFHGAEPELADLGVHMVGYRLSSDGIRPWEDIYRPLWWVLALAAGLLLGAGLLGGRLARRAPLRLPEPSTGGGARGLALGVAGLLLLAFALRAPSLTESYAMTEYVHAEIAGGDGPGLAAPLRPPPAEAPTCRTLCARLAAGVRGGRETQLGCEYRCLVRLAGAPVPEEAWSCAGQPAQGDAVRGLDACLPAGGVR